MSKDGISIYFYAGDFVEAARRYDAGESQSYATHDELIRTFVELGSRGHRVDLYSLMEAESDAVVIAPNVTATGLGGRHHRDPRLTAALKRDPNAAIVCHFPSLALHHAVWRTGKRGLSVLADSFDRRSFRARVNLFLLRHLLNSSAFEFVANHGVPATKLLADAGVRREKLFPWNVPFARTPRQHGSKRREGGNRFSLCFVGSVIESKGVPDLIRAVAASRGDSLIVDAKIVGRGDIPAMRQLAASLGVSEQVRFTGLLDNEEAFQVMRESDAVVVPSRYSFQEGFPLVLFEALASRTPIICSDHPIFAAAFTDGADALLFKAQDHQALLARIRQLASDTELYAALSSAAPMTWERVTAAADWSTMIMEWAENGKNSSYLSEMARTYV
ncbi:glycosyltransferase family 4 protein [Sphingomonas phyllosphaerae]|uniref:glycosyltransferase family 4 protein n=1 Tax=Sphingomonas phyllosphaerae TaxID=257003 RepID=UPI0024135DCF|nr:glycosyltransferase family 4 protein [Sphingomonas phyllosphaerae]